MSFILINNFVVKNVAIELIIISLMILFKRPRRPPQLVVTLYMHVYIISFEKIMSDLL